MSPSHRFKTCHRLMLMKYPSLWPMYFIRHDVALKYCVIGDCTSCTSKILYITIYSVNLWQVRVMASIRKPKRITICGNDQREYLYLVKGGEDLRQDQRIEQLFVIMNDIFRQDPTCRQHRLTLRTYQVIPMTTRSVTTGTMTSS